ncbi:MAG: nitrilase-related carbon-nitrogen hydrolase, partial [Candidatus Muiribacteriaceae bacterium]
MKIRAGYYQNSPLFGRKEHNITEVYKKLEGVRNALVVLPELFAVGYNFQDVSEVKELSEVADSGITFDAMKQLSHKNDLTLVFGFAEKEKDRFF